MASTTFSSYIGRISFDDRSKFTDSVMEDIIDTVKDPLGPPRLVSPLFLHPPFPLLFILITQPGTQKWWMQGENPWQVLATCAELVAATAHHDPSQFVSHLPVHSVRRYSGQISTISSTIYI